MARFRVLAGTHEEVEHPKRILHDGTLAKKTYIAGAEFDSPLDLTRLANKFEMIHPGEVANDPNLTVWDKRKESLEQFIERVREKANGTTPVSVTPQSTVSPTHVVLSPLANDKPLEQMSLDELKRLAEAEEVDLRRCNGNKDKIIAEIRKQAGVASV